MCVPFARNPVPPVMKKLFPLRNLTIPIPSSISIEDVDCDPPKETNSFTAMLVLVLFSVWPFPFGDRTKLALSTKSVLAVKIEEKLLVFIALLPLPWQYTKLFFFLVERKIRPRLSKTLASLLEETEEGFKNKASIMIFVLIKIRLLRRKKEKRKKKCSRRRSEKGKEKTCVH